MNSTKAVTGVLLGVHGVLLIWAVMGFVEWFHGVPPWPPVSNPLFPRAILFMHWTLILAAGIVFIAGVVLDWSSLPVAMSCVYAAMAVLCAVETFRYMESETRVAAMVVEYVAYAAILAFLFRSRTFRGAGS